MELDKIVTKFFTARSLFHFDTPRFVKIREFKLGLFFRLIQFSILVYVIGFVFIYQHGYQTHDRVFSTVITKVKGVAFTNFTDEELGVEHPELYRKIWDTADYVFPAHGGDNGGFFLMTNIVITPNQTRGQCPEDPIKLPKSICTNDTDCQPNFSYDTGHGVQTGRCVPSTRLAGTKTCEISAWCPVSQDILPMKGEKAILRDAHKFKILVKNAISFPKLGPDYLKRNILEGADEAFLKNCIYDRKHPENKFCPIFLISDIVGSVCEFDEVSVKGGVFLIRIKWDCNLDLNLAKCHPHYKFRRMDRKDAKISPGLNFRYAEYQNKNQRTLYKVYGIKFLVEVTGWGRKFSVIPVCLNIGAGLGLLGLAQVFAGYVVGLCVRDDNIKKEIKKRKFYDIVDNTDGVFEEAEPTQKHQSTQSPEAIDLGGKVTG